ncbi:MAG: glycosyltransferase family 4 protein [Acidimicrobiales bacterium]|nr:glycosyltransferase family 4 protein [Acidimicrobiales bacterium]
MRVLAVINALGEGGTERSLAELLSPLAERGIDITIATLRSRGEEGVEPTLRAQGHDIRLLPSGRAARLRAFRALLHELQPDVVHSMLFEANLLARLGTIGTRPRVLTSLVNTSYSPQRIATLGTDHRKLRAVQLIDAISGRLFVDRFHAVSIAVRDDAIRHLRIPAERITVVGRGRRDPLPSGGGGPRESVRRDLATPAEATVLINVGRQEHQKDHLTLVRAVAPLLDERPDLWLLIAGREGNESAQLERELHALGNPERIVRLGHRGDVANILVASDLFVFTSRYEGMPGAVIEAMSVGLPVVASDIAPVREVVEPNQSALLASVGNPDSFRHTIAALLADPARRAAIGQRGRRRYEEQFTVDAVADHMAELYRSLI